MKTTIGGDRLGSGNKQEVQLRTYNRSTHDLSYLWRSSMSSGTLVPFMSEVGLPGDSFDIELNCEVLTLPTIGPLFGSYKVQLDVFQIPIRLYNGQLHMNKLGIGMDMSAIKLPQLEVEAYYNLFREQNDNSQINPSSILSYLNIRGIGRIDGNDEGIIKREFNAVPYLAYWDIYKDYYANKQEERGFVIHNDLSENINFGINSSNWELYDKNGDLIQNLSTAYEGSFIGTTLILFLNNPAPQIGEPNGNTVVWDIDGGDATVPIMNYFGTWTYMRQSNTLQFSDWKLSNGNYEASSSSITSIRNTIGTDPRPQLKEFPLKNIDNMRENILADIKNPNRFLIKDTTESPYGLVFKKGSIAETYSKLSVQEGLGIKTYQSDLFNNWISTEWIDGTNGINEVTAISTTDGSFTIDALNLASKVYNMLNRIAISGGSYDDWLDAAYTHERARSVESPVYQGSLIKELAFEEVISNADTEVDGNQQPLGTLAGRGRLTGKNKGGQIRVKVDEPSYIMGIVSLTPRIDYSQGNKWDTNLKTMNDFHKPALDEIGYQDLITDQMAWFDTEINEEFMEVKFKSAGKQPAWINYMTNVNQVRGNFANESEMFMTLNRRYEHGVNGIKDLTTYVDPSKFNHIFADARLDAQNFWVQISSNITARRKMSAKVIPNL